MTVIKETRRQTKQTLAVGNQELCLWQRKEDNLNSKKQAAGAAKVLNLLQGHGVCMHSCAFLRDFELERYRDTDMCGSVQGLIKEEWSQT